MAATQSEYGASFALAQPHVHISWRAILAGIVVALGIDVLLSMLGVAVGLTAFTPTEGAARGVGIGLGIWLILTAIASVFAGAYYAARVAGDPWKGDGIAHGIAVWAGFLLLSLWLLGSGMGRLLGTAAGFASGAAGSMMSSDPSSQAIAALTSLGYTRADAERIVRQQARPATPREEARTQAQTEELAKKAAGTAATGGAVASWVTFGLALLSLGGGALGGMLGAAGERKQVVRYVRSRELEIERQRVVPTSTVHPIG